MAEAYIVEAVRTAGVAGEILNALVDRTGLDPAAIDDVKPLLVADAEAITANRLGDFADRQPVSA